MFAGDHVGMGLNPIYSKKPHQLSKKDYSRSQASKTPHLASISLSGSKFGFDAFCGTIKKLHKDGDYRKHGNCRMARSYRNVQPIVAKASNIENKRVPTIMKVVAATAIVTHLTSQSKLLEILMTVAMSKSSTLEYKCVSAIMTAISQHLISHPKHQEILMMGALAMAANFPLGMCREHGESSPPWLTAVVATIPFIPILGNLLLIPKTTIAYTFGASVLGQVLGAMAEQHRLKSIAATTPPPPQYHRKPVAATPPPPPPPPPETKAVVGGLDEFDPPRDAFRFDIEIFWTLSIIIYLSLERVEVYVFGPSSWLGRQV